MLTLCNLLCGILGIYLFFTSNHSFLGVHLSVSLILLAMIFDFLDGLSARLLQATSIIGKDLDSLADLVSFGVAPSLFLVHLFQQENNAMWYLLFLIPLFTAYRLALFNHDNSQSIHFKGLNSPANALFLLGMFSSADFIGSIFPAHNIFLVISIVCFSSLMISNFSMFSFKLYKPWTLATYWAPLLLIIASLFFFIVTKWLALVISVLCYVFLSLIWSYKNKTK